MHFLQNWGCCNLLLYPVISTTPLIRVLDKGNRCIDSRWSYRVCDRTNWICASCTTPTTGGRTTRGTTFFSFWLGKSNCAICACPTLLTLVISCEAVPGVATGCEVELPRSSIERII